jgi:hypothetical protein
MERGVENKSIEIGPDVFIDTVPVSENKNEGQQQGENSDDSKISAMPLETFPSILVAYP